MLVDPLSGENVELGIDESNRAGGSHTQTSCALIGAQRETFGVVGCHELATVHARGAQIGAFAIG